MLVTVGCGRIYFDPLGSDDAAGSDDDGAGDACQAVETCNGVDDNCDNVIDDGCPCAPFSVSIGEGQASGAQFTGTGWLAVRDAGAEAEVVRLDTGGVEQGRWKPFDGSGLQVARVAWTGTHLALLHHESTNLSLSVLDAAGQPTAAPIPITSAASSSTIGFGSRGDELAVVWASAMTATVGWFDSQGMPLSEPTDLRGMHATAMWEVRIASRHDGWAIAWTDYHQDTDGDTHEHVSFYDANRQLLRTLDLGPSSTAASIAATATGYAMVFDQAVMDLVEWDAAGNVVRPVGAVTGPGTNAGGAKLGFAGSALCAAWTGNFGVGSGIQAVTALVDGGTLAGVEILSGNIQATGGSLTMRDVHATADRTGIVWNHAEGGNPSAMFLAQRCP